MLTKKSIAWIIIVIIIFEFMIIFKGDPDKKTASISIEDPFILLIPILIILTSVITKEIACNFYDIKIDHNVWEWSRWGIYRRSHLKKPIPLGLILPFFLTFFSLGTIKPLTFLQFDSENVFEKRILKQRWWRRKMEMNEYDPARTVIWSYIALMCLSLIGIIIKFPYLIKYPIYFGLWNLIPFGKLDGSRLFFGSSFAWVILTLIFLVSGFFIIVLNI